MHLFPGELKQFSWQNVLLHWDFWCKKSHKQHNKWLQVQYNRNWVKYHACVTRYGIHSRIQCKKKASEGSGKVHGISLATFLDRCLGKFSWHQGNVGLRQKWQFFRCSTNFFQIFIIQGHFTLPSAVAQQSLLQVGLAVYYTFTLRYYTLNKITYLFQQLIKLYNFF